MWLCWGLLQDEEEEAGTEDEEVEEKEGNEEEVLTDDADDAEAAANTEDIEIVESDENEAGHPPVEGDSEATRPIASQSTSSNNTGAGELPEPQPLKAGGHPSSRPSNATASPSRLHHMPVEERNRRSRWRQETPQTLPLPLSEWNQPPSRQAVVSLARRRDQLSRGEPRGRRPERLAPLSPKRSSPIPWRIAERLPSIPEQVVPQVHSLE